MAFEVVRKTDVLLTQGTVEYGFFGVPNCSKVTVARQVVVVVVQGAGGPKITGET